MSSNIYIPCLRESKTGSMEEKDMLSGKEKGKQLYRPKNMVSFSEGEINE